MVEDTSKWYARAHASFKPYLHRSMVEESEMKITDVEPIFVGNPNAKRSWLFVKIHTDEGIVGLGESGMWGYPEAVEGVIKAFKRYLIGADPMKVEHHWQYLYRNTFFLGSAILSALAAIDVALWDIVGKSLDVPVYQLFGGKYRSKIRVYNHIAGDTTEALVKKAEDAVKKGFTAIRFIPYDGDYLKMSYPEVVKTAVDRTSGVREAVGDHVDVCLEFGRRLKIWEAIRIATVLEEFNPLFMEDVVPPDDINAMAFVSSKTSAPLCTGERQTTIFEFKTLLEKNAVSIIRPDVAVAGGLSNCKKIAALAESFSAGVIPHSCLSPVTTASSVQLAACIPNFILQEYKVEDTPPKSEIVVKPITLEGGYLIVPDTPGIGIELNDNALEKYPYIERAIVIPIRDDGGVSEDGTYTSEFRWDKRKLTL